MHLCMRTTLDLNDRLLQAARERAALAGKTLTAFVEEALAAALTPPTTRSAAFVLRWKTHGGRTVPGVDLSDRDALYERMEGRA